MIATEKEERPPVWGSEFPLSFKNFLTTFNNGITVGCFSNFDFNKREEITPSSALWVKSNLK